MGRGGVCSYLLMQLAGTPKAAHRSKVNMSQVRRRAARHSRRRYRRCREAGAAHKAAVPGAGDARAAVGAAGRRAQGARARGHDRRVAAPPPRGRPRAARDRGRACLRRRAAHGAPAARGCAAARRRRRRRPAGAGARRQRSPGCQREARRARGRARGSGCARRLQGAARGRLSTPVCCWPQAHVRPRPKSEGAPAPVANLQCADSAARIPRRCEGPPRHQAPGGRAARRGAARGRVPRVLSRAPRGLLRARDATALGNWRIRALSCPPANAAPARRRSCASSARCRASWRPGRPRSATSTRASRAWPTWRAPVRRAAGVRFA
jgi:hypothetical protein